MIILWRNFVKYDRIILGFYSHEKHEYMEDNVSTEYWTDIYGRIRVSKI